MVIILVNKVVILLSLPLKGFFSSVDICWQVTLKDEKRVINKSKTKQIIGFSIGIAGH